MSEPKLASLPVCSKPEVPPIIAALRTVEAACAERDRIVAANVEGLCRALERRGHED